MKLTRWSILLLAVTIIIGGCAGATEEEPLRIGVMADLGAVPFVMADAWGFYESEGIEVEIEVFRSAIDRDAALQTGNLDAAMVDMLTVVFFNDAELEMKMLMGTDGGYHLIASPVRTREDFDSLEKIQVGVSSNTVIDFTAQMIAERSGFAERLEKIIIPKMPVRLEMLASGELDGASLPEPLASASVASGGIRISSTDDYGIYPGIFMASAETLENEDARLKALFTAYNTTVDRLNSDGIGEDYGTLVERVGFPSDLEGVFAFPDFHHAGAPDEATYATVLDWMRSNGLTESEYAYEAVTDLSVIGQ